MKSTKWRELKECPICGDKGKWCTTTEDMVVVLCRKATSNRPVKQKDGSVAWLHASPAAGVSAHRPKDTRPRLSPVELENAVKQHQAGLDMGRLARFAAGLSLSPRSLLAYGVGYDHQRRAWSFPMRDGKRKIVGIHYRDDFGGKSCMTGSRLGLFIPDAYADDVGPIPIEMSESAAPAVLILPEGLSDSCAAFDLGFRAIGRPSNASGGPFVAELLESIETKQEVFVFSDNDETKFRPVTNEPFWPGIEGAIELMGQIIDHADSVRFLLAPKEHKDLRGWLKAGCTTAHMMAQMLGAQRINRYAWNRYRARIEEKRKAERKTA